MVSPSKNAPESLAHETYALTSSPRGPAPFLLTARILRPDGRGANSGKTGSFGGQPLPRRHGSARRRPKRFQTRASRARAPASQPSGPQWPAPSGQGGTAGSRPGAPTTASVGMTDLASALVFLVAQVVNENPEAMLRPSGAGPL